MHHADRSGAVFMMIEERQQILAPPSATRAAWCCFDHEWYLQAYPEVHNVIDDESFSSARQYYVEHGRALGHSPNMLFAEKWYLRRYPDAAAAVASGELGSGYEHYCTIGYLNRSPHWLYDDETYARYSADVTDQLLIELECFNRYDHYLKFGAREGRIAHLLFEPATYRADAVALSGTAGEIDAVGAFAHYLERAWRERADARTSIYFDAEWYLAHDPTVRTALDAGEYACALHHYLAAPGTHDPRPEFSERFYLDQNPDIAAVIHAGALGSGYEHFLKSGVFELRAPSPQIDLAGYVARHGDAESSVEAGSCRDVFEYMLRNPDESDAAEESEPALSGRGHIDFYGYHTAAHGWFFCGWVTPEHPALDGRVNIIAYFEQGQIGGAAMLSTLLRADLAGAGVGVAIYLRGSGRPLGSLISLSLTGEGIAWSVFPSDAAPVLRDQDLIAQLRPIVGQLRQNASKGALVGLAARRGYTGKNTLGELADRVFVEIDQAIFCPPDGLVLIGWTLSHPGVVRAIRLHSGHDSVTLQPEKFLRIARPDVLDTVGAQHGFQELHCGFATFLGNAYDREDQAYLEVETARGQVAFRSVPDPKLSGMQAIRFLLDRFEARYDDLVRVFDNLMGPAISSLNRERLRERPAFEVIEFGTPPAAPVLSVIVPLHGRIDFMEHQFALFSRHSAAIEHEFIYVLDDPGKMRQAEQMAASVHARFRIPLRLVLLARNIGFGPANNVGLGLARGRYICFMNSDIFPDCDDWMERLVATLGTNPELGVVGPLLLFEDRSVQHMGMAFEPLAEFGNWLFPIHERKGWRPPAERGLRRCRAITGAFMMMERRIAEELGGFDESFAIGDFEDSDLCLRLAKRGLGAAVDLDVTLYHLERQSQAGSEQRWRQNLTLYNAWLHEGRWGEELRRAAEPLEAPQPAAEISVPAAAEATKRRRSRSVRATAEASQPA
jgi:GT2 family glycosyltransferase